MTLIPLSDARLQPQSTRLSILHFLAFAAIIAAAVFVLVPRGISVGDISVHAGEMLCPEVEEPYQCTMHELHDTSFLFINWVMIG